VSLRHFDPIIRMREEIKLQQEGGQPSHMQNLVSQLEMARENSSESTARRIFLDSLINKLTPEIGLRHWLKRP
jgi:hypothetical protein